MYVYIYILFYIYMQVNTNQNAGLWIKGKDRRQDQYYQECFSVTSNSLTTGTLLRLTLFCICIYLDINRHICRYEHINVCIYTQFYIDTQIDIHVSI